MDGSALGAYLATGSTILIGAGIVWQKIRSLSRNVDSLHPWVRNMDRRLSRIEGKLGIFPDDDPSEEKADD